MTLKPIIPSHIIQILVSIAASIDSLFIRLEVIFDGTIIVHTVRVLIVVLALLMGYIHTPKENNKLSAAKEITLIDSTVKPIIENVK